MALWETNYTKIFHHRSYDAISPTRPELSAAGKTVFISGGGRGLGVKIVEGFAQAGAAHIIVTGRSVSSLSAVASSIEAAHPSTRVSAVAADVASEEDMARAFADIKTLAPGGIDVFVANAGYLPTLEPLAPASGDPQADGAVTADWWRGFEVNLKGTYLQARHFLAAARPGAVFINTATAAAHVEPTMYGLSSYAGSKLGAARVVETLQCENKELRFYNVHPGCVPSDMLSKSGLEALGEETFPTDEPELPGNFVVWLASPEGEFLKGKFVWANWDVDELKARKDEILAPNKLVTGLVGWV